MEFYCDYEALEFRNKDAEKEGIYPYYLDRTKTETSLCPLYFAASNSNGNLVYSSNCLNKSISFLDFLDKQINKFISAENKVLKVWFHNVSYDFRIIAYELFYNGFKNILDNENITYTGEYETDQEKSFSIVGKSLSSYIGVNIYYRGFKIMIRDTMRIINQAQDDILKTFGYPKKVDVDWNSINIDNLRDRMKEIEERCIYDVTSLAKCFTEFKQTFFENFRGKSSTAAGMSLDALKYYLCKQLDIPDNEIDRDTKDTIFRDYFPKISGERQDLARACYSGAICTVNNKHAGKLFSNLQMLDINSGYPYAMTKELPYGEGEEIYDFQEEGYAEYIVYISFKHRGIPFQRCHTENRARSMLGLDLLPKEKTFTRSQFPNAFTGYLCINSIDLRTLQKHSEVSICKLYKGVVYKTSTILKGFIEPLYNQRKNENNKVLKEAIKLLLNSLYGKFAQDLSGIVYVYDDIENYNKVIAIDNDTLYKPLASAVTAWNRKNWVDTVYLIGDDAIYGDTDSVYFKNVERCMRIFKDAGVVHENELGKWALDEDYGKIIELGKFLSKKNYLLQLGDGYNEKKYKNGKKLTCVGLSKDYHEQVNFDNFIINSKPFEVHKMVNIYGGKAMRTRPFNIRERNFR